MPGLAPGIHAVGRQRRLIAEVQRGRPVFA